MSVRPALVALAAALTLGGCASGDDPDPLPVPTSAPSSAAPTTAAPTPMATAVGEAQAVEAAARFYFEGFDRALDAKDASLLAQGSTADCSCRSIVQDVKAALAQGTVEGNRYTVERVVVGQVRDGALATAEAVVSSSAGRVVASDGRVLQTLVAQDSVTKGLVLRKEGSRWLVLRVTDQ